MRTRTSEDEKASKRLLAPALAVGGIVSVAFLIVLWRNYQTADYSLLSRLGASAVGLLPPSTRSLLAEQARTMGLPLATGSQAYWYVARAGGVVAYVLLWLATCWGVMMSSKVIKGVVDVPVAFALHEYLPILGVVFAVLHALVLLGDDYIGFTPWQLFVPFTSPYKPLWTGLGVLAFYLFIALIASFYVRQKIGQKTWRTLHYTSYVGFLMALLHGLMAGSDSAAPAMRTLYLITGGAAIFLVLFRLLAYAPRARRAATRARQQAGTD
jgi:DMSO/TMAO reductase YedYZ heme-binding membrane subunit